MGGDGDRRGCRAELWQALVAASPMAMAVVAGERLRLEAANEALSTLLGRFETGASLREAIVLRLGAEWVHAADAVRETGTSHHAKVGLDEQVWSVRLERLDAGRVGIYALRESDDRRELVHALRNSIFGIRAATGIVVRRGLDDAIRPVLEQIASAAEQAEACLKEFEPKR